MKSIKPYFAVFLICSAFAISGWASETPVKAKRPSVVILYTAQTVDKAEQIDKLGETAKFAIGQYDLDNKTKTELNIIAVDDQDDPQHALKDLKKIYAEENLIAVVGPLYSNVAMGLKDWINEVHIPLISIFATHNDLTKNSAYIFRICASNSRLVKAMAEYLIPIVQKHKLNIISFKDLGDDYSTDVADNFRMNIKGIDANYNEVLFRGLSGIEHLRDLNAKVWSPTKKDVLFLPNRDIVAAHILAAMETEPYLVAAIDTNNFLHLMKKVKSQHTHIRIMTTSQWQPQKSNYSKKIEQAYIDRFGHALTLSSALAFDAAYTLAAAYHRSILKSVPLVTALKDGTKITGVTGTIFLGHDGERVFTDQFLKEEFIE